MPTRDYSIYLPSGRVTDPWGACVHGAGHTRIRPGCAYPPSLDRHPRDHALSWQRGRVLNHYQIVQISEGEGRFDSTVAHRRRIAAGTVFLLFPGVWHRYEPRPETGWVEDWIELSGTAVDRLLRQGLITPRRPVYAIGMRPEIVAAFDHVHALTASLPPGHRGVLATLGLQILALVLWAAATRGGRPSPIDIAIRRAQTMLSDTPDLRQGMEAVAQEVGMSYSHFRREFRARTGLSPKQYHLHARLRRTQELLSHTDWPLHAISQRLGYDSPFHLSADFKARTGLSPTQWRSRR